MRLQEYNEHLFSCDTGMRFVQCGSADLALDTGIAVEFNERFDVKERLLEQYPNGVYDPLYHSWSVRCIFTDPVFTVIIKDHYYDKATYISLHHALRQLKEQMHERDIHQVAMPAIGCGTDRLDWKKVKEIIISTFEDTDDCIDIYLLDNTLYEQTIVDVYPTHLEMCPYKQGSNFELEKKLSTWNEPRRRYIPFAYSVEDNILLLPKGLQREQIQNWYPYAVFVNHKPEYHPKKFEQYQMLVPPKNEYQEQAIAFLTQQGDYAWNKRRTQFTLESGTGSGKTVATIFALLYKRTRVLIISHQDRIRKQWLQQFQTKTTVPLERICIGSDNNMIDHAIEYPDDADVFISTHQTIHSYVRKNGWKKFNQFLEVTGIGIKVFDESHLFFENILRIDLHTNVKETYYLSATLGRSSSKENQIMRLVFSDAVRYIPPKKEQRKHVVYIAVTYNSYPDECILARMQSKFGFSATRFIQYAIDHDPKQKILKMMFRQIEKTTSEEGRTLIVSPTIDSSNYIANQLKTIYPKKKVGFVNSSISKDERNQNLQDLDIISSTIKSSGTGADLWKLRFLHCLEPHSSMFITKQLAGRLREYSATDYTYMFDYFDLGIPQMNDMMKRHQKVMEQIAVKMVTLEF